MLNYVDQRVWRLIIIFSVTSRARKYIKHKLIYILQVKLKKNTIFLAYSYKTVKTLDAIFIIVDNKCGITDDSMVTYKTGRWYTELQVQHYYNAVDYCAKGRHRQGVGT